jgi:hypothetical protein
LFCLALPDFRQGKFYFRISNRLLNGDHSFRSPSLERNDGVLAEKRYLLRDQRLSKNNPKGLCALSDRSSNGCVFSARTGYVRCLDETSLLGQTLTWLMGVPFDIAAGQS